MPFFAGSRCRSFSAAGLAATAALAAGGPPPCCQSSRLPGQVFLYAPIREQPHDGNDDVQRIGDEYVHERQCNGQRTEQDGQLVLVSRESRCSVPCNTFSV